jgi:L-lactate dehydrogenase complex protein LldF
MTMAPQTSTLHRQGSERSPRTFRRQATFALHEPNLQAALSRAAEGFVGKRAKAVALVPEFERLRDAAARRKDEILADLDTHLTAFEAEVTRHGGVVHWAPDAESARQIILEICRAANARVITKGKSMVAEEIGLNGALEAAGYQVVETDLGEYIIQLAGEAPSHIIAPAVHKTKEQVSDLFAAAHGTPRQTTVQGLVTEARLQLRQKYFQADVGITGANFLVAETGQTLIVTNEGNGDLTQTLARVHIVTAGIERVVGTLEDVALFLRLLARSATGQDSETYTTYSVAPRRPGDQDGPEAFHVVLVDNGRSRMLAGPFRPMLRCIRCGACMNHCPVYGAIGGHAYGWVYPGPMGAVLTPLFTGLDNAVDLPNACTLNGRCGEVCPVKIPLPDLLRRLRHEQHKAGLRPTLEGRILTLWRMAATRPALYHALERLQVRLLALWARGQRTLTRFPFARGWFAVRDLPTPPGRTFLELWQMKEGEQ